MRHPGHTRTFTEAEFVRELTAAGFIGACKIYMEAKEMATRHPALSFERHVQQLLKATKLVHQMFIKRHLSAEEEEVYRLVEKW